MTPEVTIKRQLGLVDVAAVVIGGIIGVGIFFTPASLARQLPSPGWILALWLLGGFIAVMGAMVLAELGGQMPRAGGFYVFLREGFGPRFGPPVAFLYGWINLLVIQPGAMAIIALILVQNLEFLTGPLGQPWASGIGIAAIAGFTWANARGLPTGAGIQRAVTALKLVAVGALVCIGVGWGSAGGLTTAGTEAIAQPTGLGGFLGLVAAGLIPVLFSFGGWQHGTYVAGVARDPARTVPGGILVGVAVVVACYLTVNLAYLALLGQDAMAGSQALAAEAASVALGRVAGSVLAAAIVVSAAGILNTICLAFPYVIFAMARDGLFPERAGRLHPRTGTPATAMAIQGAWASVVVLAGAERIDLLLAGLAFGEWAFFAAVAVALLRLRRTWPPGSPGFRAPLWAAVGFAGIAAAIAIGALVVKPAESAFGVGVLILGLAVYAWRQRRVAP